MKCSKCGSELKEGLKFCLKCGQPVSVMPQTPQDMNLENQRETMRIQREDMQRASRLQAEQTFLEAHQTNLKAGVLNNATENGINAFRQQQPQMGAGLGMSAVPQMPSMGGALQMLGMPPMQGL